MEENAPMKQTNNKGDHVKTSKKKFPLIFDQIGWNSFAETQGQLIKTEHSESRAKSLQTKFTLEWQRVGTLTFLTTLTTLTSLGSLTSSRSSRTI